ncbi:MAG: ribulokinase [Chitinophagaceae bacterium]|nr:ribulokinase [Chitinophagaceae bacterium]
MSATLPAYVIGVDFGTDSVRAILVNTLNGDEIAASVFYYPRWRDGLYCDPASSQFRQHPLDFIEGLESTIQECLRIAGKDIAPFVRGISVDTTGSTPVAVDNTGTPLSLLPGFENNPNAQFVLWKDHTALKEAVEINAHAKGFSTNYLQDVGGIYSSEWFWAKLLHTLRVDEHVRLHIASWVEHCDWIPFLLTGGNDIREMKRSVCAAGHKALWSADFGGLPPDNFFNSLNPLLEGFTQKLFTNTYTADQVAGSLSEEWAQRLGLHTNVVIGIGAFDAHMGAVGGQIEPYHLSKVMGTSTCDMMVVPLADLHNRTVRGICGQVPGSVIPGMMGLEAGQSAFGDVYAWFSNMITSPIRQLLSETTMIDTATAKALQEEIQQRLLPLLANQAAEVVVTEKTPIAVDWLNGRRTPDADQSVKAAISGLDLGTDTAQVFYSLAEATCFGARAITDRFTEEGIQPRGIIGLGGVAKKSPFIMQLLADILQMPVRIHKSEQSCAMGAAMFAATAAGIYPKVEDAMLAMGQGFEHTWVPEKNKKDLLDKRYQQYQRLAKVCNHKHFIDA